MRIWVGIPTYNGTVTVATSRSLISEIQIAPTLGHNIKVTYLPGCSLIHHARNQLCQQFLDDPWKPERMVFVDADVGWEPGSLIKLATYNKDVIAGIYRYKVAEEGYPMGFFTRKGEAEIRDGLITVAGIPMGFTAISRHALEFMKAQQPERSYDFQGVTSHAWFDSPFMPGNGDDRPNAIIGEDVAFAFRWRSLGGKCWVDPDMTLIHTDGLKEFPGNLGKYLRDRGAVYSMPDDVAAAVSSAA